MSTKSNRREVNLHVYGASSALLDESALHKINKGSAKQNTLLALAIF